MIAQSYDKSDENLKINHQTIKERKNFSRLIKYLISFSYSLPNNKNLPVVTVPNTFRSFEEYKLVFEPLILNEFISIIQGSLESLIKNRKKSKYVKCLMKLNVIENENIIFVDLKRKSNEEDSLIIKKNVEGNEIFDISFANNYMILISANEILDLSKVNNGLIKKADFCLVGYMNANDDNFKFRDSSRVQIHLDPKKVPINMKNDWTDCYIYPIEKITTFLR